MFITRSSACKIVGDKISIISKQFEPPVAVPSSDADSCPVPAATAAGGGASVVRVSRCLSVLRWC